MDILVAELSATLHLQTDPSQCLNVQIHKDNVDTLTLGQLELCRMTPHSKHYTLWYYWFGEHIGPRKFALVKIDTSDQLENKFTKGVGTVIFQRLRKKLMGW